MAKINERIKELREEKGLSIVKLANDLNVNLRTVHFWEKSERVPNADSIVLIAKYFGVSTDYLLGVVD